ncbi:MAG: hypothetical protein WD063_21485 [Pirellulales bacterium]
MAGLTRGRPWTVRLFSLVVMSAAVARADDPRDVKIRRELETFTRVDFKDTPVEDGLVYLSDLHDIPIKLDAAALQKARIDPEAPLTAKLEDVPLEFALWKILSPNKMSFMIKDHMLTVTTEEKARAWQKEFSRRPR